MRGRRTPRPDRARETFLKVLAETCNVTEAARAAGIGRRTAYEWRQADQVFAADWAEAEEEAGDKLEREAWRRAVEGIDKPIVHKGEITDTYKEYSDRLLEILLKAHRGDKFVDRMRTDLTSSDGSMSPPSLADFYADLDKENGGK